MLVYEPARPVFEFAPVPVRPRDPYAVGLANASLLGIGYGMLRRPRLAVGAAGVSVVLVILLATAGRNVWFQAVVLAWWIAVTVHGWYLAGGRLPRRATAAPQSSQAVEPSQATEASQTPEPSHTVAAAHAAEPVPADAPPGPPPPPAPPAPPALPVNARRDRLVALLVAAPVILACTALRLDASRIEGNAADAHRADKCAEAVSDLDGLWFGHRLADAPLTARAEESTEACELLLKAERQAAGDRVRGARTLKAYAEHPGALWDGAADQRADLLLAEARDELEAGLTGDTDALSAGFGHLSTVLDEFDGGDDSGGEDRGGDVDDRLDEFLGALPTDDACQTKEVTDWLGAYEAGDDGLARAADVVPEVAPAAMVDCGDKLMADDTWKQARTQYEQLLDEYPDHELAGAAEAGVERADLAIQLDKVRGLLEPGPYGEKPGYCDNPAPYRGAKAYRGDGPHRAMLIGQSKHRAKLPSSWLAKDPKDAVAIICAGGSKHGATVANCPYESDLAVGGVQNVAFKNREIPVRVYELRTGKLAKKTTVEIGGSSCPAVLEYTYYGVDAGPPSEVYVTSSESDVRAGYESLIYP
ncbi:hypothetical protein O7599_28775 [Streptomyces sp. WMMC500]|uniref:hypothetical protein n=1 Tax=Streptomyces sp. WMMC500 TaxID=3015154 RepID=UPI00248CCD2B|nr:hypothetical protein [Streptomyces sp. WMMC500]WBB59526.1 hypothetical protein O7599_28775 [Streptomyces sp. WMMC500]